MQERDSNNLLDTMVGAKLRERRRALELTQSDLGEILGISHQQVQRYESGENTLSLQRLLEVANALNVKPEYFLDHAAKASPTRDKEVIEKIQRPLRILLVEDSPADGILLREALKRIDVPTELHNIQHPEKVIPLLQSPDARAGFNPDLILLDINMPRMNGLELLKKIKHHDKLKTLPVVMLTNSIRPQDMLTAYRYHANGFVQKSTDIREFYQDIERVVSYWTRTIILPSAVNED